MRVAILAPNYYPAQGGNAITVRRIERHLRLIGCEVRVFAVGYLPAEELREALLRYRPDLLHAFHAYLGGVVARALAHELALPYLVTLTGTDVYQALTDHRSHETHQVLRGAARIVAFHASMKKRLAEHLATLAERTVVIAQGVEPGSASGATPPHREFVFLLPAGLRPVKNLLFPLEPLRELYRSHPELRLNLVGPILDPEYGKGLLEALERHPFAQYLGSVEHREMAPLYAGADVVLNSSLFEGGMANSVLEALAYGKPVLASDIEGNRSLVKDGSNGFLYRDAAEFAAKAEKLLVDPQLRERMGRSGRALAQAHHVPEREAQAYLDLYREILAPRR